MNEKHTHLECRTYLSTHSHSHGHIVTQWASGQRYIEGHSPTKGARHED